MLAPAALDNGALFAKNRSVLKHARVAKHVTIHGCGARDRSAAAIDPVTAKAIIGHTTDRMREHYSTVGTDEADFRAAETVRRGHRLQAATSTSKLLCS